MLKNFFVTDEKSWKIHDAFANSHVSHGSLLGIASSSGSGNEFIDFI